MSAKGGAADAYSGCGDFCGACYSYWCDWNWEGYCCSDTWGNYW